MFQSLKKIFNYKNTKTQQSFFSKIAYEIWIGIRYGRIIQRNQGQDYFISLIAIISMLGISLGVTSLITVLSVMNGFQKDVRDRMLSALPHIEIYLPKCKSSSILYQWKNIEKIACENKQINACAPFISAQAILLHQKTLLGIQVKGVDPEFEINVSNLNRQMQYGSIYELEINKESTIIIGYELAYNMNINVGDQILILIPKYSVSLSNFKPYVQQLKVVGIFSSGYHEYDSNLAFMHIKNATKIFQDTGKTGVRLSLENIHQAPKVTSELREIFTSDYEIYDWSNNNKIWFEAVQTEKHMMFLILVLIVIIASFNLLSSMVMLVKDKKYEIAILRTMGSKPSSIAMIFIIQGALIGTFGTILGILNGIFLTYNIDVIVPFIERMFGINFLHYEIYFISILPSDLHIEDIVKVGLISLILSFSATLYPSWRASCLQPAQILR